MTEGLRVIAFTVRWLADRQIHDIVPAIDGQPLLDLIDRFELAAGMRPAGGAYGGLIPAFYRYGPLDKHFLGKENPGLGPKTAVLGCECGEANGFRAGRKFANFENLSEIVIKQDDDGTATVWFWWEIAGTPIEGSSLVKFGKAGVLSETICYYGKTAYAKRAK